MGKGEFDPVTEFDDWYDNRREDHRNGTMANYNLAPCAQRLWSKFEQFKTEHLGRTKNYDKYEMMANAEVVSRKPDLPNVSSGEVAGMVRRIARNVVQHTPNVEIVTRFDDDSQRGILAKEMLRTKVIGDVLNSNQMQQNLFASVMTAFTVGFDAVCPVMVQRADKSWAMEYDVLHYNDVFPEPGVKDVRKAPEVFVRRYLTKGEVAQLIRTQPAGWDIAALRTLFQHNPPAQQRESVAKQNSVHHVVPDGYEIITWYSRSGDPFLTFDARHKLLLRIERNTDPQLRHPVHFLILERDPLQPLGTSQIALIYGRQEFQDLMLNGAMKLWYRNINPTMLGFGTGLNGVPNMSPGKYVNIPNPNAKIEPFEVNTQTLLQYGAITQQNEGSMINLVGAADQQMAAAAGHGMSATPQGVEAQTQLVDITTNNYQKAVEFFFSQYCSYALTVYFQELKGAGAVEVTADTRQALISAGIPEDAFNKNGELVGVTWKDMAIDYNVRCVPGSLVELEDEKQMRLLQQIFVPLSQAMPALAATQDQEMLRNAAAAMQFIVNKTIQLSGSAHAEDLQNVFQGGPEAALDEYRSRVDQLETGVGAAIAATSENTAVMADAIAQMQQQIGQLTELNQILFQKLGVSTGPSASGQPTVQQGAPTAVAG